MIRPGRVRAFLLLHMKILFLLFPTIVWSTPFPKEDLPLNLDATKGVQIDKEGRTLSWTNQAPGFEHLVFKHQDQGRKIPLSGCPIFRPADPPKNLSAALTFRQQELVCPDEDIFDSLTTGKGHTWIAVIRVFPQRVGLKNVNSFFGNLRNGGKHEGLWGCLEDDNSLWYGTRNGLTFGRFDKNNPKLTGPQILPGKFQIIIGRQAAGTGTVLTELFLNKTKTAVASTLFPVNPNANPSRMTIGQERDAIEHPGHESFDGEIARFLIWGRPLKQEELSGVLKDLRKQYVQ